MAGEAPSGAARFAFWLASAAMLALTVRGLAAHDGFQPAAAVRSAAPVLGLMAGGAFTHAVARYRRTIDVEGEFNPGGRALFMGVVMLAFTLLAWLTFAQGLPSFVTSMAGAHRSERAVVAGKPPAADGASCAWRLELSRPGAASVTQHCVSQALWSAVSVGDPLAVDVVAGPLGSEPVGIGR